MSTTDWWQKFDRVGGRLQTMHPDRDITHAEIMSEVGEPSWSKGWPSDYCYNRINKDPGSFRYHLFKWVGHCRYRYLGPNYPYTGKVMWKREPVGQWIDGKPVLDRDPRQL